MHLVHPLHQLHSHQLLSQSQKATKERELEKENRKPITEIIRTLIISHELNNTSHSWLCIDMSLGLLCGYGSASGSEISDSEEAEEEEERGTTPSLERISGTQSELPANRSHVESLISDKVARSVTDIVTEGQSSQITEVAEHKDSSASTYYGLGGGSDVLEEDSSSSLESDQEQGEEHDDREGSPLPLPELDGSAKITASVFSNPYREAEEARLAVLKQHVALSQHIEPSKKQPKWSKKRGKYGRLQPSDSSRSGDQFWNDGDSPVGSGRGGIQRKHRSGVGESLEPPRKYMKIHQKIQSEERPWTTR